MIINDVHILHRKIQSLNADISTAKSEQASILESIKILTNPALLFHQQQQYESKEKFILDAEDEIKQLKAERHQKELSKAELANNVAIETLDNFSIEDKARLFKKYLNRVVYYSETQRQGTFVVDFKNGTRIIVCIHIKAKSAEVVELPHSFQFDEKNRSILVTIPHRVPDNKLALLTIKYTPYTAKEVMDMLIYQKDIGLRALQINLILNDSCLFSISSLVFIKSIRKKNWTLILNSLSL